MLTKESIQRHRYSGEVTN